MNRAKFVQAAELLKSLTDKNGDALALWSFIASDDQGPCAHYFDHSTEDLVDLRSVSKAVVALTVGAAEAESVKLGTERVHRDMFVLPVFQRLGLVGEDIDPRWSHVRLWHLLNNSIGHEEGFLFRKDVVGRDPDTLVSYVFGQPIEHDPGTHFSYSNVGPFLVSVMFQEALGRPFGSLAWDRVLSPLGVSRFEWTKYGRYDAGCTGLQVTGDSLHRVGKLLAADGKVRGKQIVPQEWCQRMRTPITPSPNMFDPAHMFPKWAYGLGLWVCENGTYYCDGTNGQYLIVVPDHNLVVTTSGMQADMEPITRGMLPLFED